MRDPHPLRRIEAAVQARDFETALRFADQLWRHQRDDVQVAHLYGRLLTHGGDPATGLRLLQWAAERLPDPDIEASVIDALLVSGQALPAATRLADAIGRYCMTPDGMLAAVAGRLVGDADHGHHGWCGVGPTLALHGEVIVAGPRGRLEIRSGAGDVLADAIVTRNSAGRSAFSLSVPRDVRQAQLAVTFDGVPLLGATLSFPPEFELDGRATTEGSRITGWARLGWRPFGPLALVLEDERGNKSRLTTRDDPAARGRQSFALDPRDAGLTGRRIEISVVLPDGSTKPLPDAPLLLATAVPRVAGPARGAARARAVESQHRPVDIIVPVYLGRDETMACIASVLATIRAGDAVVVVDDASPDIDLAAALDGLAARGSITLLRNETNLGFAGAVNRGLALHDGRDAVLLNADAVVHGNWLDRLQHAAYGAADIGTATPFTNCGAVASYPGDAAHDCTSEEAVLIDRLAAEANAGTTVELPVGVGFCLYIRRDCLAETGPFDAATFGKGYGEENDFCMRARQRGWRHVLAGDVFVRHVGGRSFGRRGAALMARNRRLLNLRHPGYDALVEKFIAADPVQAVRRRLDEARLASAGGPYVLLVALALPGGVERFVRERCRALRASGLTPIVLQPLASGSPGCVVSTADGTLADLRYAAPAELPDLRALLERLAVDHVEIHHFLDCDSRVIETVRALDVPYDVYVHDYVWICPRIGLVDGDGRYCGEPQISACETCVKKNGSRLDEPMSVAAFRRRNGRWLAAARRVIAPCADVAHRLHRYFPDLRPSIEPWEAPPVRGAAPVPPAGVTRIALIGAIGWHKGYRVLLDCARDAAARNLPLEFVVIGFTEDDEPLHETGKVFITGRYEEEELNDLLRRERPHLALFPSATPETWCYTLSAAIRAGVRIVAFDTGAVAERLRMAGQGILIPSMSDPARLNERLLSAAATQHETGPTVQEREPMRTERPSPSQTMPPAITGSVEVVTLQKGLYHFSVRAGSPQQVTGAGNLIVPAVHVGVGPGLAQDAVKIVPRTRANGPWLFAAGNSIMVKVSAAAASLVLTSVRGSGGQALVIEVERVDGRGAAKVPLESAAAPQVPEARRAGLPLRILAHVRNRGDMNFADTDWAGRVGTGLWLEAFAVTPLEAVAAADVEYKGLTATGIETPWISNGLACGTRGMSVPLMGFAVRLKPPAGAAYDCEYSGYFQSGTTVGPLRNGAPCRSSRPNDPLEGIQLRLVPRRTPAVAVKGERPPAPPAHGAAPGPAPTGPRFSKFRQEISATATEKPGSERPKDGVARASAANSTNKSTKKRSGARAGLRKSGTATRPKRAGAPRVPPARRASARLER
ncbi:MAG TPA: glycosyltransferase [Stellaceae bacterium]|nr:glycosyltransferase [Stellaceae bacterium]